MCFMCIIGKVYEKSWKESIFDRKINKTTRKIPNKDTPDFFGPARSPPGRPWVSINSQLKLHRQRMPAMKFCWLGGLGGQSPPAKLLYSWFSNWFYKMSFVFVIKIKILETNSFLHKLGRQKITHYQPLFNYNYQKTSFWKKIINILNKFNFERNQQSKSPSSPSHFLV